ncbi:MAG: DUF4251 domain-containing protein [Aestuariibaculum sp.]
MKHLLLLLLLIVLVSCGTSKNTTTQAEIDALSSLILGKAFNIESDWAYPQATMAMQQVSGLLGPGNNAGSINLTTNSNFLKIKGDSVYSYLPYYGERQMNVGYGGTDSSIEFKGLMENYSERTGKNQSVIIAFDAQNSSNAENFTVTITLWPNLNSQIYLNSISRNSIQYIGRVEVLKDK